MTTDTTLAWHQIHDNLITFARALAEDGDLSDATDAIDFFERPWKWDDQWAEFQADDTDPYVEAIYTVPSNILSDRDQTQDRIQDWLKERPVNMYAETRGHLDDDLVHRITVTCRRSAHEALAPLLAVGGVTQHQRTG